MANTKQSPTSCRLLLVTEGNFLDDTIESAGQRQLFQALLTLGLPGSVVGRFLSPGAQVTEPVAWLKERGWAADVRPVAPSEGATETQKFFSLHMRGHGVPVTLLHGGNTQVRPIEDAEREAFGKLVQSALDEVRPDVIIVRAGPSLPATLALARARNCATLVLQPDCLPGDASDYREADLVLSPTRFAADYLREAIGLPSVNLPPPVVRGPHATGPTEAGAVVFGGAVPKHDLFVYVQIASELHRRRPELPLLVLGGSGQLALSDGGRLEFIPENATAQAWARARLFVDPQVGWQKLPLAALSALGHGIPVIASNHGANPEILEGVGQIVPLPDDLTPAQPTRLRPEELTPWIDAILRLCDDADLHARQRALAFEAGQRCAAELLASHYAELLTHLAQRRRPGQTAVKQDAAPTHAPKNDAALRLLAERHPWPRQQPADAAPGQQQGWLGEGSEIMLARSLSRDTRLVVELGSWLGLSTRYIASLSPAVTIISVDTWEGSTEHQANEQLRALLAHLFETFQSRCWDYRDRIVPLHMKSLEGLHAVAAAGLQPDVIYIDAEHSFEAVSAELALAQELFPHALLTGDDYDWLGVRQAADAFAHENGYFVERFGARGWRLLQNWQVADAMRPPPGRRQSMVLVPYMGAIEWECEQALRLLEAEGVRVVRKGGCSAIDVARNELLSTALHDEAEAMLFIDSDVGFEPQDALRLLARPEPVISGVYAKKGMRELASTFVDGTKQVVFGPDAVDPYPLKYAATGFLRLRADVLRRMIAELKLPLCNTHWGRGVWPFFQPLIVPHGPGKFHYLGEDWAFSYRLTQMGVTPLADTSIRLWHWGRYSFSWEDAGKTVERYRSYTYHFNP